MLAIGRWGDPLAFSAAALLVWAALRFGARGVAWSVLVMVAAADWAAARAAGPFDTMLDARDASMLLQVFVAVTAFAMLGLALALDERDAAEVARANAAERFRRTFHDSPVAMAVTTVDGRIVETNRALCALLVLADHRLVGTNLHAYGPDDSGEHDLARRSAPGETRLVSSRGDTVWVEISESPLRRLDGRDELQVVVLRDVTERKVLQQQLFHAQKMESVGRLAGGIAHDFNNVLAVMRGQVELLQDDLEVLDSARARIDSVQRATDRAAALTDDLMAFSRQRVDEPEPFDLHELLLGVRELLHQVLGDSVTLELELEATATDDRRRPQPPRAGRSQPGGERARRDAGGRPRHHHDATTSPRRRARSCCASATPARAWIPRHARASSNRSSRPSRRASAPDSACRPPTTSCVPPAGPSRSTADAGTAPPSPSRSRCPAPAVESGTAEIDLVDADLDVDDDAPDRARGRRRVRRARAGRRDPAGLGLPGARRRRRRRRHRAARARAPDPSTCS